jgi:TusA-related sulfurtransferase
MQIIYNRTTQFVIDVNEDMTKEEILEMSEQELIEAMTDITYQASGDIGEVSNQHGKVEFELLDDDDNSIRYFEQYVDD